VQITDSLESSNPSSFPWIHYQACLWPVRVTSADFLIKIFFIPSCFPRGSCGVLLGWVFGLFAGFVQMFCFYIFRELSERNDCGLCRQLSIRGFTGKAFSNFF
jgi:hypothetical protein